MVCELIFNPVVRWRVKRRSATHPNLDALTRGLKPHGYRQETAPRSSKTSKLQRRFPPAIRLTNSTNSRRYADLPVDFPVRSNIELIPRFGICSGSGRRRALLRTRMSARRKLGLAGKELIRETLLFRPL